MGKFILGLIICSSVYQTCLEPYHWPDKFNSHYECMIFGYEESIRKLEEIGREDINKHGMYIRFTCTPDPSIWHCGKKMVWET